jgi:hypothetical protein
MQLYTIRLFPQNAPRFRRFFRPSSGAQKLYIQHVVIPDVVCIAQKLYIQHLVIQDVVCIVFEHLVIPDAVCIVFELLMMGRGTA